MMMTEPVATGDNKRAHSFRITGDVHLVLTENDRVLFGLRQNTGYEDGSYHLPSGHLEDGESLVVALIREAKEEIGVSILPEAVEFSHVMHNSSGGGRVAFFFVVRTWDGEPENREPDKCAGLRWFSLSALPDQMIGYCRTALASINAGQQFSLYGW